MNKVTLMGRLGKDPELRKTTSGKSVCNFSVATTEGYGEKQTTTWHEVVAWEKTAEACAMYLNKGKRALIDGRIQIREFEDKSGAKRKAYEIVASSIEFLDRAPGSKPNTAQPKVAATEPGLDDIPF